MKKVFATLAALGLCFVAFAQNSSILDDWDHAMEERDCDDVFSSFSYTNVTYNNIIGTTEGEVRSGWGIELSALHLGFKPWKNGRFTLGLFDMAFDFSYLAKGYYYAAGNNAMLVNKNAPDGTRSSMTRFAYMFPLGYIHSFGDSTCSVAFLVSPGVGWDRYRNLYNQNYIHHEEDLSMNRGAYFRMDLKAMVWFRNVGFVARYTFPKNFQAGPSIVSAGISLRI